MKRILVSLMSALFFAPTLLSAQTQIVESSFESLRLSTRISAPVLERVQVEGLGFTAVSVEGFGQSVSRGLPALPLGTEMIEVPQGATPVLVIDRAESYTLDLAAAGFPDVVFPAQGPRSKNPAHYNNTFFFDTEVYASYRAPETPVSLGAEATLHGLRIAYLHITPVIYHPASHTLEVFTRIDYHVNFEGADMTATREFKAKYASAAYKGVEQGLLHTLRMPEAKATAYTQSPVYVIVSHPMFRDSLQKFVAWKTLLGFRVIEAYTDEAEVGRTKESIRAYLKKLYTEATPQNPAPSYVLFVGDVAQIPTGTGYSDPYPGGYDHVSDLYLCEYTGDRLPDVLYGRMSATNVNNLMPQIDKLMYMENIPYEKTAFLDSTFLVAGYDQDYGRSYLNPTVRYIQTLYLKDSASRHCSAYFFPQSTNASSDIIANINNGVAVGVYTAHGEWNMWTDPKVNNTDVEKFTNKDKYPFLVGNCCLSGKLDKSSCFGETLLRKKDAGAVAYIGASNSSYFDEDVYWAVGYTANLSLEEVHTYTYANTDFGANDAFFHTHGEPYAKWALSVAEILHAGNMAVEKSATDDEMKAYYWQIYHVFGDPSYRPYNHRPVPISAVYPKAFKPGTGVFEVSAQPYAWVALSCGGENVAFAVADAQGRARLDVSGVTEECTLSLCISAQNALPLLDEIRVAENVSNEEGGASPGTSSLRLSVVRAHNGRLQVAVCSPRGEVSGVLKVVNVLGSTVAVLDPALRAGIDTEEHTYEVGDLPSGLYLCTLTTPAGRTIGCKFVVR